MNSNELINILNILMDAPLKHYGVKGMKWKNHVYAQKQMSNDRRKREVQRRLANSLSKYGYGGNGKQYGLSNKSLSPIAKKQNEIKRRELIDEREKRERARRFNETKDRMIEEEKKEMSRAISEDMPKAATALISGPGALLEDVVTDEAMKKLKKRAKKRAKKR